MLDRSSGIWPGSGSLREDGRPLIVGVGGTNREGSSSERALRLAMKHVEERGCRSELVVGAMLDLPSYDPAVPHRAPAALRLVDLLRRADGVMVATPSYHGGFSGLIKNALDYTEDLRDDSRCYLDGRVVGIIVTAYGAQGLGTTMSAMRSVVHALRGWPTPFGAAINSIDQPFKDGMATPDAAAQVGLVADQVADFALMRSHYHEGAGGRRG